MIKDPEDPTHIVWNPEMEFSNSIKNMPKSTFNNIETMKKGFKFSKVFDQTATQLVFVSLSHSSKESRKCLTHSDLPLTNSLMYACLSAEFTS